jgi:hypothetical protein
MYQNKTVPYISLAWLQMKIEWVIMAVRQVVNT